MNVTSLETATARRSRLFSLLNRMIDAGARPSRISDVDQIVMDCQPGLYLKHDVHGLDLPAIEQFAASEAEQGIVGSYFFMVPNHPLTAPHYDWNAQVRTMHRVREVGHEIGLHIDPYFLIDHDHIPLAQLLARIVDRFRREGISLTIGNMHGNSKYKHPDHDGYGTMFDLFDELARQPDYPELHRVPEETATLIRANRLSLREHGFTHWADMPMWSSLHGFVVTNLITDNMLGKRGTLETYVHTDTINAYKLCDVQHPGSRTLTPAREAVPLRVQSDRPEPMTGSRHFALDGDTIAEQFESLAPHPTLFLIHPEFYC